MRSSQQVFKMLSVRAHTLSVALFTASIVIYYRLLDVNKSLLHLNDRIKLIRIHSKLENA